MAEQLAAHVAASGGLHPLEMELAVAMGSEQFQMAHMVSIVGRSPALTPALCSPTICLLAICAHDLCCHTAHDLCCHTASAYEHVDSI